MIRNLVASKYNNDEETSIRVVETNGFIVKKGTILLYLRNTKSVALSVDSHEWPEQARRIGHFESEFDQLRKSFNWSEKGRKSLENRWRKILRPEIAQRPLEKTYF